MEELNSLLADVVPGGTFQDYRERAITLALMGHDREIPDPHEQVRRLARKGERATFAQAGWESRS
jgi:hypothetical protein